MAMNGGSSTRPRCNPFGPEYMEGSDPNPLEGSGVTNPKPQSWPWHRLGASRWAHPYVRRVMREACCLGVSEGVNNIEELLYI